jgi:hypothetical protein
MLSTIVQSTDGRNPIEKAKNQNTREYRKKEKNMELKGKVRKQGGEKKSYIFGNDDSSILYIYIFVFVASHRGPFIFMLLAAQIEG